MRGRHAGILLAAVALACAHGLSRKDRQGADVHHDLGVEAIRNGRAPDALHEFDEAIRLDPQFAEAHRGRGLVLEFGFGKLPEAEAEYRKALELKPAYPEAQNDLGQLLAKTGRAPEALAHFDDALGDMLYREPWVARCNKGQVLWRLGRREEGLAEMHACLKIAPSYCAGHRALGLVQLEAGRMKEAVDELTAYARLCDHEADAHYQLGLARMKEGDLQQARDSFQRCEQLGGTSPVGDECRRSRELLQ
ncbi:MAG TPA: tetratricopeptide repeat protein [Anaeromyxobacteraceae bacterium]|nr:tetratricopeptide repeat protein [Anaeromyxobacteraceae bacterium]